MRGRVGTGLGGKRIVFGTFSPSLEVEQKPQKANMGLERNGGELQKWISEVVA